MGELGAKEVSNLEASSRFLVYSVCSTRGKRVTRMEGKLQSVEMPLASRGKEATVTTICLFQVSCYDLIVQAVQTRWTHVAGHNQQVVLVTWILVCRIPRWCWKEGSQTIYRDS